MNIEFWVNDTLGLSYVSKDLLWGWIHSAQSSDFLSGTNLLFLLLSFVLFKLALKWESKRLPVFERLHLHTPLVLAALAGALLTIRLSLRLSEGWDETFINLRHSWMLGENLKYSANAQEYIEATVDFLTFFSAGLFSRLGANPFLAMMLINWVGVPLVLYSLGLWVWKLTKQFKLSVFVVFLFSLFPPFLYISSTGFTAVLFVSVLCFGLQNLYASYQNQARGLWVLSILPLIRIEGILFNFFIFLDLIWARIKSKQGFSFKNDLILGLRLSAPFIALSLFRKLYFGHWVPTPVTFKNAGLSLEYIRVGFEQFWTSAQCFYLDILLLFFLFGLLSKVWRKLIETSLLKVWMMTFLFTLPYFTGGGDWFPIYWNRYMLPLTLMSYLLVIVSLYWAWPRQGQSKMAVQQFTAWILLLGASFFILKDTPGKRENSILQITAQKLLENKNRWERVDRLAALGLLFEQSLRPSDVIASSEMATIMYHAKKDLLDLMGIANPDVAKKPLDPQSPGNVLARKHAPEVIVQKLPAVIALYEMAQHRSNATTDIHNFKEQKAIFDKLFWPLQELGEYRAGPYSKLVDLGYSHMVVLTPNFFFNYFIHSSAKPHHVSRLNALGFHPL